MSTKTNLVGLVAIGGAAVAAPHMVGDYWTFILTAALLWGFTASAWNIAGGFAGQLSLGHGVYFGAGAYSVAALYNHFEVSPLVGMLLGMAISAVIAAGVGYVSFRTQLGHLAFAILTLSLSLLVLELVSSSESLGGKVGLFLPAGVFEPWNLFFGSSTGYYYLVLFLILGSTLLQKYLLSQRIGRYWVAIRDNEPAAVAAGVNPMKFRILANVVSGLLTSVAGSIFALTVAYITADSVLALDVTINIILFAVVGGLGTILGPYVGAALLYLLAEYIRSGLGASIDGLNPILYGGCVLIIVLLLPGGLVSIPRKVRALSVRGRQARHEKATTLAGAA